jgi:urease accessory protein
MHLFHWLVGALLAVAAPGAFAHTGFHSTEGFVAGFAHPLAGADHLLAMTAVGLWAAVSNRRGLALAWLPLLFMGGMLAGGWIGAGGAELPHLEFAIAASVAVLGGLVLGRRRGSPATAGMLAALFGGLHGYAHGLEASAIPDFAAYAAGFVFSTGLLHLAGIGLGIVLIRTPGWRRALGGAIGIAGLALMAATF